jgi:hypothetical protein
MSFRFSNPGAPFVQRGMTWAVWALAARESAITAAAMSKRGFMEMIPFLEERVDWAGVRGASNALYR